MAVNINIQDNIVTLNGHQVEGWSQDEDALTMPDEVELATVTRGGDGQMFGASTAEIGGPITIKLLPTSPSTKFFLRQVERIRTNSAPNDWSGTVENVVLGYSVSLDGGILVRAPYGHTVGKGAAATRMFTIEFETVSPNYDAALFD